MKRRRARAKRGPVPTPVLSIDNERAQIVHRQVKDAAGRDGCVLVYHFEKQCYQVCGEAEAVDLICSNLASLEDWPCPGTTYNLHGRVMKVRLDELRRAWRERRRRKRTIARSKTL
jgi:hypothetical protein